jgi:hypothetical protein
MDSRCSTLLGTTGGGRGESPTRGEFGGGRRSVGAGGAEAPMAARRVGRARSVFRGAGAGHQVSTRDNAARASISRMVFPAIFAIQSPAYSAVTRLATVHNPHTVTRASEEYAAPRGHRIHRLCGLGATHGLLPTRGLAHIPLGRNMLEGAGRAGNGVEVPSARARCGSRRRAPPHARAP